jgi:hypothetical protein
MECDNAFYPWQHVIPDAGQVLLAVNYLNGLRTISQHQGLNAFHNPKLDIGWNLQGFHGIISGEPLYKVHLGLFIYMGWRASAHVLG